MHIAAQGLCHIKEFKSPFYVTLWLNIHEIIHSGYPLHLIVLVSSCCVINHLVVLNNVFGFKFCGCNLG